MYVFASVGTHPQSFDRLIKELQKIASNSPNLHLFAQTGNSALEPKGFPFKKFLNEEEYMQAIKKADVIVSHGGAGTIINSLRNNKPLVIVPRLQRFSEHTNDHQLDLALALASKGKAIAVKDVKDLRKAIQEAANYKPSLSSERQGLIKEIKSFLQVLDK